MSKALDDIAAEHRRQVEAEGWTETHDDLHSPHALSRAAACYALANEPPIFVESADPRGPDVWFGAHQLWPWDMKWWKPKDVRRNLVRAGALIVAAIERLDRSSSAPQRDRT